MQMKKKIMRNPKTIATELSLQSQNNLPPQTQALLNIANKVYNDVESGDISAVSILVSPGFNNNTSTIVYNGANSLQSGALPNSPTTTFGIGSNTKSFISVMIQNLIAAGKFTLNASLGEILTQYKNTAWSEVTIQQLLNMTGGLPDCFYGNTNIWTLLQQKLTQNWSPLDILELFIKNFGYPTLSTPGSNFYYSNLNFILLSQIIEFDTGLTIENNFNNLIASLNLTGNAQIYYKPEVIINDPNPAFAAQFAHLYYGDVDYSSQVNQSFYSGAGGLIATANGMLEWYNALYTKTVVTSEQLQSMQQLVSYQTGQPISEVTPDDPYGYGLGIAQMYLPNYGPCWWYEGNITGATCIFYRVPTANLGTVTIVLNTNTDDLTAPLFNIMNEILGVMGAKPTAQFASEIKTLNSSTFTNVMNFKNKSRDIPEKEVKSALSAKMQHPKTSNIKAVTKQALMTAQSVSQSSCFDSIHAFWKQVAKITCGVICGDECEPVKEELNNRGNLSINPYRIIKQ